MSRQIFKTLGIGIMASALLVLLAFLVFTLVKIAFFFLVIGGLARLFFKRKFNRGFNHNFGTGLNRKSETPIDALEDFDFFQNFNRHGQVRRNKEIVSVSIQ